MGCLKNIIRAVIITLAVVGFMSLGGKEWTVKIIDKYFRPSAQTLLERAQKVGDFSKINDEFEIEKAAGIMGYQAVLAEHKASGQKLIVVDDNGKDLITAEDLKSDQAEEKLKAALGKLKYQSASIDNLTVTKHGTIKSYGKDVPYVKFEAKVKKLPIGDIAGMVAVAKTPSGEARILLSANEKAKYSQLISDQFFKDIK